MNAFDRMADGFDTRRRVERARHVADAIRARIEPWYKTAMEFGCGTGLNGERLLDAFEQIEFIDSSEGMIVRAKEKLAPYKNATARVLNLSADGAGGLSYDFIFSSMVLHHIRDAEEMLKSLAKLLTPAGKLVIVDLMPVDPCFHLEEEDFNGHHGFELSEFSDMMARAGLEKLETEIIYEGEKPVRGENVPYALFLCAGRTTLGENRTFATKRVSHI